MKILYAIQGTGNGHLSRARDIIPVLASKGELDILVSGTQADIGIAYPVLYRFKGLSFVFGKKGGVDLFETYKKGNLRRLLGEIQSLPIERYDLVINDFEPVSAWACYIRNKPCISLSHQTAVLHDEAPQPDHIDLVGKALLKFYAPTTASYGFHFKAYDNHIFTPVIRRQIRDLQPETKGHYTVYLPAYDDKRIVEVLSKCSDVHWEVFSKHNKFPFKDHNVSVYPIDNEKFIQSMAAADGIICGAGFETPAEAMFLGKKLMVIPMKNQFEQHCNAAALKSLGVPVLKSFKKKHCEKINEWIRRGTAVNVDYPDNTEQIIDRVLAEQVSEHDSVEANPAPLKLKSFRKLSFDKILHFLGVNDSLA